MVGRTFSSAPQRVALLYQGLDPPVINGVSKPKKVGGYTDSCADIANALKTSGVSVVTPSPDPDPASVDGWSFPDTEEGIQSAIAAGANCLWANTVVFSQHPLQVSTALDAVQDKLRIVGHAPTVVEAVDDKHRINAALRAHGGINMSKGTMVHKDDDLAKALEGAGILEFPVVGKPVRGRGSHGVKLCNTLPELEEHIRALHLQSDEAIIEEFLAGEEATVTVLPPAGERTTYVALPVVKRFNHVDGVAPYSGKVAVSSNSCVVAAEEATADPTYAEAMRDCEKAAAFVGAVALMRIDIRRVEDRPGSRFALFDVNMKPNMTGPGRPGREDQAALTALAAEGLGWDYHMWLQKALETARTLRELRAAKPNF